MNQCLHLRCAPYTHLQGQWLAALLNHEEDRFSQLTDENLSQQIRPKKMVDQLYSEMIGAIAISSPLEDNTNISRDDQLTFVMQRLEEDEVHNLE